MTVEAAFIEKGIYLSKWVDIITADDVVLSQEQVLALADEQGDTKYVLVVDARDFKRAQITFQLVRKVIARNNKRLLGYVIIGMSVTTQVFTKAFGVVAQLPYKFAKDQDEAVSIGREWLKNYQEKIK
jgi:hypothetical protein